mgnify:FL=1
MIWKRSLGLFLGLLLPLSFGWSGPLSEEEVRAWILGATEEEKEEAILRLTSALEELNRLYSEALESSKRQREDYEATIRRIRSEISVAESLWRASEASFEKSLRESEQKLRSCGTKVTALMVVAGVLSGALIVSVVR